VARLLGTWTVTLPGETFTWEPDEMMRSEWKQIHDEFGGTFEEWTAGIDARDPDACQVLIWWLRHLKGIDLERESVDFKIRMLKLEAIPDPEDVAVVTASTTATSEPSPDGAGDLVTSTP